MDFDELLRRFTKFIQSVDLTKLSGLAVVVFIIGIIILGITFILPVAAFIVAAGLIVGVIYFIYKLLGGK
jgi:hypothetical protein